MNFRKHVAYVLSFLMMFSLFGYSGFKVAALEDDWSISSNQGWISVYTVNTQNDYLNDQQTGSGSVSQDIVGDGDHPSVYKYVTDDAIAFRVRVSNVDKGTTSDNYEFKNFFYVGLDVDCNGSVDFFLGTYAPSSKNGTVAIYSSDGSSNMGPSTTGISVKAIESIAATRGENYSIIDTDDGSNFNGDKDYFVSYKFDLDKLVSVIQENGFPEFSAASPVGLMTGTAAQDNSFNQDINGMDKSGWNSERTWTELDVMSDFVSLDGKVGYCKVVFDSNSGDNAAEPMVMAVKPGDTLGELPSNPSKVGMDFQGWNTKSDGTGDWVNIDTVIDDNVTVYAIWAVPKTLYNVEFETNGGSLVASIETDVIDNMPITSKTGYSFEGWYDDSSFGESSIISFPYAVTANQVLFANWAVINYEISYDLDGGQIGSSNPLAYNIETETFNLSNPGKLGYDFAGWTGADLSQPSTAVAIAKGSTGEKSYTANWTSKADVTISYESRNTDYGIVSTAFETLNPEIGEAVGVTATANDGYHFVNWVDEFENVVGTDSTFIPEPGTEGKYGAMTYTAVFAPNLDTPYTVEHYVMDSSGNYPQIPSQINWLAGTTLSQLNISGLTSKDYTEAAGLSYSYAMTGGSIVDSVTIAPDGSLIVKIYYERSQYQVALSGGSGVGKIFGAGTYYVGAPVNISVQLLDGYVFSGWVGDNETDFSLTGNQIDFVMPANNISLEAIATAIVVNGDFVPTGSQGNDNEVITENSADTGNDQEVIPDNSADTVPGNDNVEEAVNSVDNQAEISDDIVDTGDESFIIGNISILLLSLIGILIALKKNVFNH